MNKQLKAKELERCKRVIESYDTDITELSAEVSKVKEKYLALAEKETADLNEVIEYYKEQKASWTENMKKLKALKDFPVEPKSVQEEAEEKEETIFDPYETEEEQPAEEASANDDFPEEETAEPVEETEAETEAEPVSESEDWPEEDKPSDESATEEASSDDDWPDMPEEW